MNVLIPEINDILKLLENIKGNSDTVRLIKGKLRDLSNRYEKHIKFLVHSHFNKETINKVEFKEIKDKIEYNENLY
jgi:hypothetical protein